MIELRAEAGWIEMKCKMNPTSILLGKQRMLDTK